MGRWFYYLEHYLHALRLIAAHLRERRIRAGRCYHPGCQEDGLVWLDRAGIFCWHHYVEQMQRHRAQFSE